MRPKRSLVIVALAGAIFAGPMPAANAGVGLSTSAGHCAVVVSFTFTTKITTVPAAHSYDFNLAGFSVAGSPQCVVANLIAPDVIRTTDGAGAGTATLWSCEAVVNGQGNANTGQTWFTSGGIQDPAPLIGGNNTIVGAGGAVDMLLTIPNGLTFFGVIHLEPDPRFSDQADCMTKGTLAMHMIGTEVFEDPEVTID